VADALYALIGFQAAQAAYALSHEREERMEKLIAVFTERRKVGDLGEADSEIAMLSLARSLEASASTKVSVLSAEQKAAAWVGEDYRSLLAFPEGLWSDSGEQDIATLVEASAKVRLAHNTWVLEKSRIKAAKRNAKIDPTLGVVGGRDAEEAAVTVNLSIPLNVFNTFDAEIHEAAKRATAAELDYQSIQRTEQLRLDYLLKVHQALAAKYRRWNSLAGEHILNSERLLTKQWQAGDLSTPDYLIFMQQRDDGLEAGISLELKMRKALVDWLASSGQITDWIKRH
jgi:outer membrane protein, heavy metal efflux system